MPLAEGCAAITAPSVGVRRHESILLAVPRGCLAERVRSGGHRGSTRSHCGVSAARGQLAPGPVRARLGTRQQARNRAWRTATRTPRSRPWPTSPPASRAARRPASRSSRNAPTRRPQPPVRTFGRSSRPTAQPSNSATQQVGGDAAPDVIGSPAAAANIERVRTEPCRGEHAATSCGAGGRWAEPPLFAWLFSA